jgi:molecular chaperone DnaK (HSP70)
MTRVSDAAIGVDFGTTNTVVAFDQGGGQAALAGFS